MADAKNRFSLDTQREVFFSTRATTNAVHYAVRTGRARRIGPRLYTKQMAGAVEDICRRNWAEIAAGYFPGSVVTGRTAFHIKPADEDGSVFLAGRRVGRVDLRGFDCASRLEPHRSRATRDTWAMTSTLPLGRGRSWRT